MISECPKSIVVGLELTPVFGVHVGEFEVDVGELEVDILVHEAAACVDRFLEVQTRVRWSIFL